MTAGLVVHHEQTPVLLASGAVLLDIGVAATVQSLDQAGVRTYYSCEGGPFRSRAGTLRWRPTYVTTDLEGWTRLRPELPPGIVEVAEDFAPHDGFDDPRIANDPRQWGEPDHPWVAVTTFGHPFVHSAASVCLYLPCGDAGQLADAVQSMEVSPDR